MPQQREVVQVWRVWQAIQAHHACQGAPQDSLQRPALHVPRLQEVI